MRMLWKKFRIYGYKKFILYALDEIKRKIIGQFFRHSYSQRGEDLILNKFLKNKKEGFYVDVGANDPNRFSNTKIFYDKGWRGINIEPDFNNCQKFIRERSRDINLNIAIGSAEGKLKFYRFIPDTLSTLCQEEAESYIRQGYELENIVEVEVRRLSEVLANHCSDGKIDFLSIDTEGYDLEVLQSNNWNRYRPNLICIESVKHNIKDNTHQQQQGYDYFLSQQGYEKVYDNGLNSIYKIKDN
ncbi:MAG: FkbM family methyltransferase [Patescibacteria group bacterium]|jgi:FkbM family methyltransferase